jgi:hypothetical protein
MSASDKIYKQAWNKLQREIGEKTARIKYD